MTLLAEDLLLLLLDDETGKPVRESTRLDRALAGAVLLELALAGRVAPADESRPGGPLQVRTGPAPDDPVLVDALARLGDRPVRAPRAVEKLVRGLRPRLLDRLVQAGTLTETRATVLGLFPVRRWPTARPEREAEVRAGLVRVLVDGAEPDQRSAALISMLVAIDAVARVVPVDDRRALVRRAREVAQGEWAGVAVRKAVDAVNAGLVAAVVASSSVAASG